MNKKLTMGIIAILIIIIGFTCYFKFVKTADNGIFNKKLTSEEKYQILKAKETLVNKLLEYGEMIWGVEKVKIIDEQQALPTLNYSFTLAQLKEGGFDISDFEKNNCDLQKTKVQAFVERDSEQTADNVGLNVVLICDKHETKEKINFNEEDYNKLLKKEELENFLINEGKNYPYFNKTDINYNRHESLNFLSINELELLLGKNIEKFNEYNCNRFITGIQVIFQDKKNSNEKETYFNPVLMCDFN